MSRSSKRFLRFYPAQIAVSQIFLPDQVDAAAELGLCYIPGALTPTEDISAWNRGVPTVKVSPVGPLGGLDYFRELLMPMPDVAMMPAGSLWKQPRRTCAWEPSPSVSAGSC